MQMEIKNKSQLVNIAHALDLLFARVNDQLASIHPLTEKGSELKIYFREKQTEIFEQIKQVKQLIQNHEAHVPSN